MQMSLRTDRALLRSTARSTRYLMISLTAPAAPAREVQLPIHVGIVLDRSGSMDGASKFALAADAVEQSLSMLRPTDRFTLVVYDSDVDVLMPSTLATREAKRRAMQRLANVGPRGGTDLHAGWMTGATQMVEHLSRECVNRVLLLTDGLANQGITEPSVLLTAARELREQGIATTTFGVGEDFDERLLRDIAHESGGQFYFIETSLQIADLLTSELGEALEVVRRNVALQIALPPGAACELLNRYRHTHAAGDNELRVELGDVTAGQELSLVVRLTFPEEGDSPTTCVRVGIAGTDAMVQDAEQELYWQYADHSANDAQPRDRAVDREVAMQYATRARAAATEANRAGDFRQARAVLEETARRIRSYAEGDAELERLWRELLAEVEMFARRRMSMRDQKAAFFAAESQSRNRDGQGKARRQPR